MSTRVKNFKVKVKEIRKIKKEVFLLSFISSDLARLAGPGQFLHFKIKSAILRRPLSVHKVIGKTIYVLFRVRGRGTQALATIQKGNTLDLIGPLGQGFVVSSSISKQDVNMLVAGGLGVAPLVFLSQKLPKASNSIILAAKTKNEIVCQNEFRNRGYKISIATDDGSSGFKGTAVTLLSRLIKKVSSRQKVRIYACGPEAMFKGISGLLKKHSRIECQVSFEQFMGCGLGICCACVIDTKKGYKKVCKEGPVFNIRDIW